MAEPELEESSLRSPSLAPQSISFPFMREGSHVWEKARDLPSPLPTKRTRTYSASQGHGYIKPANGGEDIFVHISDIEGEYVPAEGDEVTYKVCPIPPKNQKVQAVEVVITHPNPGTKHETWSGKIISS
ncbi:Cold shock domain-containing protein C2 [Bagarius yarrelli]|uniref:Cold shock domain-containing protein C2 n=1 Tax=Bagarius yarrelli TaxID=175774 RepID=A0A556V7V5_BAGYA|nr:Cold shock domain-containing protein C2 [Bagarius yarrelli]